MDTMDRLENVLKSIFTIMPQFLSIVKEAVCKPFVYPTPFELHFSVAHLNWYLSNPEDYIEKMNGTDKDLAAHFTIIYHRGKTLYGKEIKSVFSEVSNEAYMDSIWLDVKNAKEDIIDDTMYIILIVNDINNFYLLSGHPSVK